MKRREFITLLGGAAAAWPLAARAQQAGKVWRIGFVLGAAPPSTFGLYRKTADALGITIPALLHIFADEVIE